MKTMIVEKNSQVVKALNEARIAINNAAAKAGAFKHMDTWHALEGVRVQLEGLIYAESGVSHFEID